MWWRFRKFLSFLKEKKPKKLSNIDTISNPSIDFLSETTLSFENEVKNLMKKQV